MKIINEKFMRYDVLCKLAVENNWKRGADLGVKCGESIKPLLDVCPDLYVYAVDTWEEFDGVQPKYSRNNKLWNHDNNYNIYCVSLKDNPEYKGRIKTLRMKTTDAFKYVEDESLDYVFVDAGAREEETFEDIKNWWPKIKIGGFMVGHDHYLTGPDDGVRNAVNRFFGDDIIVYDYDKTWYHHKRI